MIIPRKNALAFVEGGQAAEVGLTQSAYNTQDGRWYVIVDRYDLQRTDHYPATLADLDRLAAAGHVA